MARHRTPFPAIVGQEELKRALLAVAVNDALDGLLVQGEKGTAKSTAVRGLVELLPDQRAVTDCPYGCPPDDVTRQCADCRARDPADIEVESRPVPLVTLPLGATRERVVGTLSVADALEGHAEFEPGLLARANRGYLYVDEVNLLDDHLVDVILEAAAEGVNRVERDGVSVEHPADFTLVGTMNPEEGELRPQLRDRFALQATVVGCRDLDDRVDVIDRALARREDPARFASSYEDETIALAAEVREARQLLEAVDCPDEYTRTIAELCLDADVDGHRADIAIARTARTIAALEGRRTVTEPDVKAAARLALPHRLQSRPFEDAPDPAAVLDDHFDDGQDDAETDEESATDDGDADGSDGADNNDGADSRDGSREGSDGFRDDGSDGQENGDGREGGDDRENGGGREGGDDRGDEDGSSGLGDDGRGSTQPSGDAPEADDGNRDDEPDDRGDSGGESEEQSEATPLVPGQRRAEIGDAKRPPTDDVEAETAAGGDGTRARAPASDRGRGARVRTERATADEPVHAAASIRAAAAAGRTRVEAADLRKSVRRSRSSTVIVFVVDASASMRSAMADAKGTVMGLLQNAYEQRDEVAFVAVAGDAADVVLPPTDSVTLAARHLKELPAGDRTPLASGLEEATRLATRADAGASLVVVVTDGRANVAEGSPTATIRESARQLARSGAETVIVDASDDDRTGLVGVLETETGGLRIPLSELSAERVAETARAIETDDGR